MDLCKDGASEDESEVESKSEVKYGTIPTSNEDPDKVLREPDKPKKEKGYLSKPREEKVGRTKPKKEKVGYVHFYEFMPIEKKLSTDEVEKHLLNNIKLRNVLINDYCRHYGDTTDEKSIASLPNYQAFINLITDQDRALVDYEKLTRKSKGKNKTK